MINEPIVGVDYGLFLCGTCGGPVDGEGDYVLRGRIQKGFAPAENGEGVKSLALGAVCKACARGKGGQA